MILTWFRRLSLPLKVTSIFILLIATALSAGLGAILVSDTRTFEQDAFAYADHRAWLVADFSAAPLSFSDHQGATEILARLSGLEGRVLVAALYDEHGELFASYGYGDNWRSQLERIRQIPDGIQKSYIKVTRPVELNGTRLGSVVLLSPTTELHERMHAHLRMMLAIFALVLLIAAVLLNKLQRYISGPVIALTSAARSITHNNDLSHRVEPLAEDEIGELCRCFNKMLDRLEAEIQNRDVALKELGKSQERLHGIVHDQTELIVRFSESGNISFANDAFEQSAKTFFSGDQTQSFFSPFATIALEKMKRVLGRLSRAHPVRTKHLEIIGKNQEIRQYNWVFRALYADDGSFVEYQAVGRDITEQMATLREKQELAEKMQNAQRLQTVGTLAGGIAHDFNNLLTPITIYVQRCLSKLKPEDEIYSWIESISKASLRARDLVGQILAFSGQRSPATPSSVSLNDLLSETYNLIRGTIPKSATLNLDLVEESCFVWADRSRLSQVVINLCTNAYQALPDGMGTITISLNKSATPPARLKLPARDYVELVVADTGCGMSEEVLTKIFEPFFTTKPVGKGTGLGLSVAQGIVHDYGGAIDTESTIGKGSRFSVYLPASAAQVTVETTPAKIAECGQGEHLLFLDDEETICEMAKELLQELGYHVSVFSSPKEALELLTSAQKKFDLLITDITMPEMSGIEFMRQARSLIPGVRVLLTTGYASDPSISAALENGNVSLLHKPYSLKELQGAINGLLTAR